MSTHTPGPWQAYETTIREQKHIVAEIANQGIRWPRNVALANARLIAAAPDLLAAVRTFLNIGKDGGPLEAQYAAAILQARAAVAKAEGTQS